MTLVTKLQYARKHIESISRHDDAPLDERLNMLQDLTDFIVEEVKDAQKRDEARQAADEEKANRK